MLGVACTTALSSYACSDDASLPSLSTLAIPHACLLQQKGETFFESDWPAPLESIHLRYCKNMCDDDISDVDWPEELKSFTCYKCKIKGKPPRRLEAIPHEINYDACY